MKEEQEAIYEESVIMLMGRYVYASCILTLKSFVDQNILLLTTFDFSVNSYVTAFVSTVRNLN